MAAFRNTRLYGLLIEGARRVNYASVNKKESREIFIREALVEGNYQTKVEFIKANRKLIEHYREQEERERRRDLLIGNEQVYAFYDSQLPDTIVDAISFESWVKKQDSEQIKKLTLFEQDVLHAEHKTDTVTYPETLDVNHQTLKLSYIFDPSDEADGVTVWIPLAVLNQFDDADFDYLVPGLLEQKIQALIKSLPKLLRKNFIPVPDFTRACLEVLDTSKPLYSQLSEQLQRMTGVRVEQAQWKPENIESHFLMRYCLMDNNVCKVSSRSLAEIKSEYAEDANQQFEKQVQFDDSVSREGLTEWDFDQLQQQVSLTRNGSRITAFPALVDYTDSVAIELFETKQDAGFYHSTGVSRLIMFHLKESIKYIQKNLPEINQSALMYISLGSKSDLIEDIIMASIEECFLAKGLPDSRVQFEDLINKYKPDFIKMVNDKAETVYKILKLYRETRNELQSVQVSKVHLDDCWVQCEYLVYEGFIREVPASYLNRTPVYFQALLKRLEKLQQDSTMADRNLPVINSLWGEYLNLADNENSDAKKLEQCRWMIEEFRINCFAQPMKTRVPVSENKIRKLMADIL